MIHKRELREVNNLRLQRRERRCRCKALLAHKVRIECIYIHILHFNSSYTIRPFCIFCTAVLIEYLIRPKPKQKEKEKEK